MSDGNKRPFSPADSNGTQSNGAEENRRILWIEHYRNTGNAKAVCEKFGISKKTFYKWLKRYKQSNGEPSSLLDRSRRPHRFPRSTPESVILLLHKIRGETGFGQRRLRVIMAERYNISISERTIWKILKRQNGPVQA